MDIIRNAVYRQLLASNFKPNWEDLPLQNRKQASDLFAGTIRMQRLLDFYIAQIVDKKQEAIIQMIFRMALYELRFTDTPDYALVSEYVDLVRHYHPKAAGFINAILRKATQNTLEEPTDLAVKYSHPSWMVKRWTATYGAEKTEKLLQWNNQRPKHTLRVNTLKTTKEAFCADLTAKGIEFDKTKWLPDAVVVANLQPLLDQNPIVQDEGAATVVRVLNPKEGMHILDACAAPGGKSCYMATLMENKGRILALDKDEHRVTQIKESVKAQGIRCVETQVVDFFDFKSDEKFDIVLLDVPCSGTGVMAKRADLRWKRSKEQMEELVLLQQKMLNQAIPFVKKGGCIVYSTCSVEPSENQEQILAFLAQNPSFKLESPKGLIPDIYLENDMYVSFPPETRFDGAFAAKLRLVEK